MKARGEEACKMIKTLPLSMISTPLDYEIFTPCFISLDMFQVYKLDMSPCLQSMGSWIEFVS